MNAPDAFESFILAGGEKKITYEDDTKIPNAGTFQVNKEDHTLGNLLKYQLLKDKRVLFSGYRMPHPLEHRFLLRVQTDSKEYTPVMAVENAIRLLIRDVAAIEERFKVEVNRKAPDGVDREAFI
eukprot:Opistho-2@85912